jgi:hypothetical protein
MKNWFKTVVNQTSDKKTKKEQSHEKTSAALHCEPDVQPKKTKKKNRAKKK